MGQQIAHTMGTTSEEVIVQMSYRELRTSRLTGMDEEQADWEEGLNEETADN